LIAAKLLRLRRNRLPALPHRNRQFELELHFVRAMLANLRRSVMELDRLAAKQWSAGKKKQPEGTAQRRSGGTNSHGNGIGIEESGIGNGGV
jgi:hypothetical protein